MTQREDSTTKRETTLGRWNPGDLAYVERLELTTPRYGSPGLAITALFQGRSVSLAKWPDESLPFNRVRLYFDNVRDLSLNGFGRTPQQVMGFDIRDISDRRLEGLRLDVGDYEAGTIHFKCSDVHVLEDKFS